MFHLDPQRVHQFSSPNPFRARWTAPAFCSTPDNGPSRGFRAGVPCSVYRNVLVPGFNPVSDS